MEKLEPDDYEKLAIFLLEKDVLFLSQNENQAILFLGCNDVFAWACADAEPVMMDDLYKIYERVQENEIYGSTVWVCIKRNMQPQPPLKAVMKRKGYWPEIMDTLPKNPFESDWDTESLKKFCDDYLACETS